MGADTPPSAQTPQQLLATYSSYLPGLVQQAGWEIPSLASAEAAANRISVPAANALTNQQLYQYAPSEASLAASIQNKYNPAYRGANQLVNSINLQGLSPGEAAATERGLNETKTATGNLGLINPTNTINNAINFGGAFNNKLGIMANAVNAASGAGGSSGTAGFGQGQFVQSNPQTANSAAGNVFGFGSNLLGNQASMNNAFTSGMTSIANTQSIPSYLSGVCCFIFLESLGYGKIPGYVRRGRDKYYYVNPFIAAGYRRMARWLVPLMRCNIYIRDIVFLFIVNPITKHLEHPKKGWNKRVTHFWLKIWSILGNNKCEVDYFELMYATI